MTYQIMRHAARVAELRVEHKRLGSVLRRNRWSPKLSAKELEITPSTLYRALERHPDLLAELQKKSPPPGRRINRKVRLNR